MIEILVLLVIAFIVLLIKVLRQSAYIQTNQDRFRILDRQIRELTQRVHEIETSWEGAPPRTQKEAQAVTSAVPVPEEHIPPDASITTQAVPAEQIEPEPTALPSLTSSSFPDIQIQALLSWKLPKFDWESLVGVKLFSWVAGVSLLLAAVFFLRYSISQGWLMPPVRMAIGIVLGVGLLVICELKAARKYPVTANAMDASAIAILFATFYAARALWNLIGTFPAFALMALVTAVAVLLSVRRDSVFIALLGLLGGFATPALLSTGENNPVPLFGYILLLNAGLAWVATQRRWPLLTTLSLLFTVFYQWGWVVRFLSTNQLPLAIGIFLVFPIVSFAAAAFSKQEQAGGGWKSLYGQTADVSALLPLLFAFYTASVPAYGSQYVLLFGFLLLLDAGLLAIAAARGNEIIHCIGGLSTLLVFAIWINSCYQNRDWTAALVLIVLFVLFYLAAPFLVRQFGHEFKSLGKSAAYTSALLLFALPAITAGMSAPPWPFWGMLLLLDVAIAYVSISTSQPNLHRAAMIISVLILMAWAVSAVVDPWPKVAILATYGLSLISLIWIRQAERSKTDTISYVWTAVATMLLSQVVTILSAAQPGAPGLPVIVFSHLLFLAGLLCLAWTWEKHGIAIAALYPASAAVSIWQFQHSGATLWQQFQFATPIYLVFLAYPLLLGNRVRRSLQPHLAAVMASAIFFFQARHAILQAGGNSVIGLLPVLQSLPFVLFLIRLLRTEQPGSRHEGRLALVAGTALAFITAAIPVQLEKWWITIGWALEAAALCWLYRRIPHKGLLIAVSALFSAVFIRLALNPSVLVYVPRGTMRLWNWYLYAYLVSAAAMIGGSWLLAKTTDNLRPNWPRLTRLLPAGAVILLFILLNIEIADYYSTGTTITFNFSATLAQDLTYTLGWALFAVGLLAAGIILRSQPARIASLALMTTTIVKCFIHDLARLGGLYRVASLAGLAVCLALVTLVFQNYVLAARKGNQKPRD
jgi:hypothetical protein